jgi:Flp pilus assembly protein TadD
MSRDAEFAYKQALDLWPGNCETVENMMNLLSQQERFQEADALVTSSLLIDPNSPALKKMKEMTEIRLKSSKEAPLLEQRFNAEPKNRPLFIKLVQDYINIGNHTKVDQLISNVIVESPQDPKLLRDMINLYVMQKNIPQALAIADLLSKVQPDQWDVLFAKAKYLLILKKKDEAIFNLQQGIKLGGQVALQQLFHEPIFQQLTNEPAFQQFLRTQQKS